jgi:DNA replication protein DnaC
LLTHPTLDQLHALGLHGMAKAFADIEAGVDAASLGHAEWLAPLLEREASLRRDKRLSKRLQYAKLRQQACVEDIDYRTPRGLDRSLLTMLVEGQWIDDRANLLIYGPSGVGKSWLASALGNKACRDNRSVLYQRVPRLFSDLALARGDGRHPRLRSAALISSSSRLGLRAARRRGPPRPPGDPRGPLRPPLHHRSGRDCSQGYWTLSHLRRAALNGVKSGMPPRT